MKEQKIRLAVEIPSEEREGHVHHKGADGDVVEHIGGNAWIVELRIPDPSFVGGAWYETFAMYDYEFELVNDAAL